MIAYFSKKLNGAQGNYSANDRELLGMIEFLVHFRCYLEVSEFEIMTDNQGLKHYFDKKDLSRREARWLETLSNFGIFPITLRKGSIHVLGDALSGVRHSEEKMEIQNISSIQMGIETTNEYRKSIQNDQFFGPIIRKIKQGETIHKYEFNNGILQLTTGELCIPRKLVRQVLSLAHDCPFAVHYGRTKTLGRLKNYYWNKKFREVNSYVKGCIECQKKRQALMKRLTDPCLIHAPKRRSGTISMEFITRLPKISNGYDSISTVVDRFSKRPHFIPCTSNITAVQVARLFHKHIFQLHELADFINSDRDPLFTFKFWKKLMETLKINLTMSTARHPQTDGQTELMNRIVEEYLRVYCNYRQNDWDTHLPTAEFAYSSSTFPATGLTPFHMDTGWDPKIPIDLFDPETHIQVQAIDELQTELQEVFKDATASHAVVREQQTQRIRPNFTLPTYQARDQVMLDTFIIQDPYSKIGHQTNLNQNVSAHFRFKNS